MSFQTRLSISALAWSDDEEEEGFSLLSSLNVRGVELLPPRIWKSNWGIEGYRSRLADHGLTPVAFQAIYFGLEGASLLGSEESFARLLDHTQKVAQLADELGVPLGVFGAPSLRKLPTTSCSLSEIGAERLARLDRALQDYRFRLCIEPLTKSMGCEYLNTCEEVIDVLGSIRAHSLCAMLDTASDLSAGKNPIEELRCHAERIAHLHLSEPRLSPLKSSPIDYDRLGEVFAGCTTAKVWASVEMLRSGDHWQRDCAEAVTMLRRDNRYS